MIRGTLCGCYVYRHMECIGHDFFLFTFIKVMKFLVIIAKENLVNFIETTQTQFLCFQDLQKGLDLGLVSPEILQNFFDLEKYPVISELIHRFQVRRHSTKTFTRFDSQASLSRV